MVLDRKLLRLLTLFVLVSSSFYALGGMIRPAGHAQPSNIALNPNFPTGGIKFGPATIIDPQRTEGEPLIHIDQQGNIWESGPWGFSTAQGFVARSTDGGDSFHVVSPAGIRPNPTVAGGGDSDIITDAGGNAYFADLEGLVNVGVAVSNDQGNNWRENSLTAPVPIDDRQWLAIDNGITGLAADRTVFLTYRTVVSGSQVLSSPGSTGATDAIGGFIYTQAATQNFVTQGAPCGRMIFDPLLRNLYLPCILGDHVEISAAHVNPGQRTGLQFNYLETPTSPGGAVGFLFSSLTVDTSGNVYIAWVDSNNHNVYLAYSTNAGITWSSALQINGDPANTNVMPWAVAGNTGTVDVTFYGTSQVGNPNSFPSWFSDRTASTTVKWFVYFVQIQNANTANPTIYQVQASEHPTDYGQLCTKGLNCDIFGGDRTLADYFSVATDANGAAHIVYDDLTNQHHGASLFELTQVAGPTAIGTTLNQSDSNFANGVTDPAGDAQVPHYSPVGPGPNQADLDLRALTITRPDSTHLAITMRLSSLVSILPPPGSTGNIWLTRWQFKTLGDGGEESYRIFYVGANNTAGQTPVFFAGTGQSATPPNGPPGNGCITTTPQKCKVVLYPAEKPETGRIDQSTGLITITVPLADIGNPTTSSILYSVTALTFGYTSGDPILHDADATRSFDFILAGISQPPGCGESDGQGDFQSNHGHGNFSFDDDQCMDGDQESVSSTDRGDGHDFQSSLINTVSLDATGTRLTITGVGISNGAPVNFVFVAVQASPTSPGWVSFTFSDGYINAGTLTGGIIVLR